MNHENVIDKPIVLSLNSSWQRLGWLTVKQAIIAMTGGLGTTVPALALDMTVAEDGTLTTGIPTKWADWTKLPVRPTDLSILTKSGAIRVPTVIIRPGYGKMPVKAPKLSKRAILERDGFRDQYTGEELSEGELSIDHVIPRSKGGKNVWENMVACEKKRNFNKGNKSNDEVGLRLRRKPFKPKAVPLSVSISRPKLKDHAPFFNK